MIIRDQRDIYVCIPITQNKSSGIRTPTIRAGQRAGYKMKVLVACEESQTVCKEFRARGHEAYSCDILPCSGGHPEWHIQDDVMHVIRQMALENTEYEQSFRFSSGQVIIPWEWDLMIAHPPCTYLCNSGVRWLWKKEIDWETLEEKNVPVPERWQDMKAGAEFFKKLLYAPISRIVIENPIMHKYAREEVGVNFGQLIQPWQFGNPNKKATGLWLKNMPPLIPTKIIPKEQRIDTIHKMPPSDHRGKDRAVTFIEIAEAMADQWGQQTQNKIRK